MPSLRFPVYADLFLTTENGNSIDSIHLASINVDFFEPKITMSTYLRLRSILNDLIRSETDVVSFSHIYILDSDYIFLDKSIFDVKVFDDECVIARIPVRPLTKASFEYLLQEFSDARGVLIELLPSS